MRKILPTNDLMFKKNDDKRGERIYLTKFLFKLLTGMKII